jgi:FkbM family methyltransferase
MSKRQMSFASKVADALFSRLPCNSDVLLKLCRRYVDANRGENNQDVLRNGEEWLMRKKLPASKVVLDIGSHVGEWAELAIRINPMIDLHCFEPSHEAFGHLTKRGFPKNVRLNNTALDAQEGQQQLFVFRGADSLNSFFQFPGIEATWGAHLQEDSLTVPCTTVDAYCAEHGIETIDLMKIDVEGSELRVLCGALGMLRRKAIRCIQLEHGFPAIGSRLLVKDFFDLLTPLDYRLFKLYPKELRPLPTYDYHLETFQYSNYVACQATS